MSQQSVNPNLSDVPRATFVHAMRMVPSSVTVVTTDGPAGRHGATVSAFSSVSADPPTILVCLRADSRISQLVSENGQLCVNVLSSESQDVAMRFAGQGDQTITDRFSGISWHGSPPEIDDATVFSASVDQTVIVGSHRIFICRVASVRVNTASPLAYLDGAYRAVVPHGALRIAGTCLKEVLG